MNILNINNENYEEKVLRESAPVLVKYWAPWCVYCRRLDPAFEKIADTYEDRLVIGQINIDEAEALGMQNAIEIIPTLVLYKNGEAVDRIVNPGSEAAIEEFLEPHLKAERDADSAEYAGGADLAASAYGAASPDGEHIHDVIIIGGGPGGYTAALYSARAGMDTVVLEKLSSGGQMAQTTQIDNYPGFDEGIDGFELGMKMQAGAERFGARTEMAEVHSVKLESAVKEVETDAGVFYGRTVIIAAGAEHRHLGVDGEDELTGRGVHYCAACDGMFYRDKTVVIVGGGNTAAGDALTLSRICKKVYLVHRRDTLRATKIYHDQLDKLENVEFVWNSAVKEFLVGESTDPAGVGDGVAVDSPSAGISAGAQNERLSGVKLTDVKTGEERDLACDAVFVSVGRTPTTELFKGQLELNDGGYIVADESTRTSVPGVFAVGDIRTKAVRQVVTAASDGAVASHYADEYIAGGK